VKDAITYRKRKLFLAKNALAENKIFYV